MLLSLLSYVCCIRLRIAVSALFANSAFIFFLASAHASVAIEATLPQLVSRAEAVVDGTAEEAHSVWEPSQKGQRIVT